MNTRRLWSDVSVYGLAELLARGAGLVTIIALTRVLSPEDYGILALLGAVSSTVTVVVGLGYDVTYSRFFFDSADWDSRARVTSTWLAGQAGIGCVFVSMIALTSGAISRLLLGSDLHGFLVLLSAAYIPVAIANGICGQSLRNLFRSRDFVVLNMLATLLTLAAMLSLVLGWRLGAAGVLLGNLVAAAIVLPIRIWSVRNLVRVCFYGALLKAMAVFGLGMAGAGISASLISVIDRWMLSRLASVEVVGIYSAAASVVGLIGIVNGAFGQAWTPHFLSVYAQSADEARKVAARMLLVICAGGTVLAFLLAAFGGLIAQILLGERFHAAAEIIGPFSGGMAISATTQVTALGISIAKKPAYFAVCTWIGAGSGAIATYVGVTFWGVQGAAWAALATQLILTLAYFAFSQRLWPIAIDGPRIGFLLGLMVSAIALASQLPAAVGPRILVGGALAIAVAGLCAKVGGLDIGTAFRDLRSAIARGRKRRGE